MAIDFEKFDNFNRKYKVVKYLGKLGGNGVIYKVEHDNKEFCVKLLRTDKKEEFKSEISFQENLKHKNILKVIDKGTYIHNKNSYLFYVTSFYDSTLRDEINNQTLTCKQKIKIVKQLCNVFSYLHSKKNEFKKKIIYGDLKPENILLDSKTKSILLCDFGLAKFIDDTSQVKHQKKGNYDYHAPEQMINNKSPIGIYSDIYSLGLIINELFTDTKPHGENYVKIGSIDYRYSFLDQIVSKMIKDKYYEREDDIRVIVKNIRKGLKEVTEYIFNIKGLIYPSEKIIKYKRPINNMIDTDSIIFRDIINNKDLPPNYFDEYHSYIRYKVVEELYNHILFIKIYKELKHKFSYEGNVTIDFNKLDSLDHTNASDVKLYESFKNELESYDFNNKPYILINRMLKLARSIRFEHLREVIKSINDFKSNINYLFIDVPIVFLAKNIRDLIDDIKKYMMFDYDDYWIEYIEIYEIVYDKLEFIFTMREYYPSFDIYNGGCYTVDEKDKRKIDFLLKSEDLNDVDKKTCDDLYNSIKFDDKTGLYNIDVDYRGEKLLKRITNIYHI